VIQGLDEFMLRTGHLKVVCNIAVESSLTRYRLERETSSYLTELVEVPLEVVPIAAEYLKKKNLCQTEEKYGAVDSYRYPELKVVTGPDGKPIVEDIRGIPVRLWWQDLCFAADDIPSKVGTVTTTAKAGGKTGLSHIFDWAELSGLISKSGQLTVTARLLPKLGNQTAGLRWVKNPYILGNEKLLLAFMLLQEDIDVSSRLILRLAEADFPLKKRQAMELFAGLVESLVTESEAATYLSSRQQYQISELARDLEQAARRSRTSIARHSTTWHRVSSRLESLVDFGLLTKVGSQKYEYTYSPTETLKKAADSLLRRNETSDWFEHDFAEIILGHESNTDNCEIETFLTPILQMLGYPRFALYIDSLVLAILTLAADAGQFLSFAQCRRALEQFARDKPEHARLARGTSGERAEFINFNLKVARNLGSRNLIH
jgi:hypothetical protein